MRIGDEALRVVGRGRQPALARLAVKHERHAIVELRPSRRAPAVVTTAQVSSSVPSGDFHDVPDAGDRERLAARRGTM